MSSFQNGTKSTKCIDCSYDYDDDGVEVFFLTVLFITVSHRFANFPSLWKSESHFQSARRYTNDTRSHRRPGAGGVGRVESELVCLLGKAFTR